MENMQIPPLDWLISVYGILTAFFNRFPQKHTDAETHATPPLCPTSILPTHYSLMPAVVPSIHQWRAVITQPESPSPFPQGSFQRKGARPGSRGRPGPKSDKGEGFGLKDCVFVCLCVCVFVCVCVCLFVHIHTAALSRLGADRPGCRCSPGDGTDECEGVKEGRHKWWIWELFLKYSCAIVLCVCVCVCVCVYVHMHFHQRPDSLKILVDHHMRSSSSNRLDSELSSTWQN